MFFKSKLTRNIIFINIIALIVLACGMFFISNYKTYLKKSEFKSLKSYASLVEASILNARSVKKIPSSRKPEERTTEYGYINYKNNYESSQKEAFNFSLDNNTVKKFLNNLFIPDVTISIFDANGNVINNQGKSYPRNKEIGKILGQEAIENKSELSDGNLCYIKGLYYHDKLVGAIMVTGGREAIKKALLDVRMAILLMFILSLVINISLSIYSANKITTPLYKLSNIANEIATKTVYNNQIPDYSYRNDEIGDLSISLRKMVDTLWQRLTAIENFASDISHEIKNPLSSLRSASETLIKLQDTEKRDQMAIIIKNDIIRLDKLVNEISSLSKLDTELAKGDISDIKITELLANIIEIKQIGNENINFKTDFKDASKATVKGNDVKIAQVFDNLISNALSFSKEGDTITVRAYVKKNNLFVSVSDEGIGIPENDLKKIFERFYSNRPKDKKSSHSGLGLAISKKIIETMGGEIFASNRKKTKGAKFTVIFKDFKAK